MAENILRKEKKKIDGEREKNEWRRRIGKEKNRKENIWLKSQNLGKHRKLMKNQENEVIRNDFKKFSKIINIILRHMVKLNFKNSILFSK